MSQRSSQCTGGQDWDSKGAAQAAVMVKNANANLAP